MDTIEKGIDRLHELRKKGSFSDVQEIINLLKNNLTNPVGKEAILLLADIKDPKMVNLLMDEIQNCEDPILRKYLLQICWESGLDYETHLPYFTNLFLEVDFESALEIFSIVENVLLDKELDQAESEKMVQIIKTPLLKLEEPKQTLALELIHLYENR